MLKKISPYWVCQIAGWGTYCIIWTFFYITMRTHPQPFFFDSLFLAAAEGFLLTHLMRSVIKAMGVTRLGLEKQVVYLFFITVFFAFCYSFLSVFIEELLEVEEESFKSLSFFNKAMRTFTGSFMFFLIWNLVYFIYHYVIKSRKDQFDKIHLESLVKELELKTIKSHINPHFIFNALNSIRALVDENPERARTAITELSNILRSSMQAEKLETTSLERELNIVQDYLALEHIRFEDRLQVEYDIDEDTLDQPVPPMMLQTLVENAIKHGISKQVSGGSIKIISDFRDDHHELIVQNTGKLNGHNRSDGFGLASTSNRLKLLFGSKAFFEIKDVDNNMVEAKVIMPVHGL